MFACPSFPFDEVVDDFVRLLASSAADRAGSRVEDFFDFELLFIIDEIGRRRGRDFLIREGRQGVRGQELLVEAWVNLPMRWKLQLVGGSAYLVEYREGADALVVELLLRSREVEVGRIQPDLVADLIIAGVRLLLVVLALHIACSFLKCVAGFSMNIAHRHYELRCGWIGDRVVVFSIGNKMWVPSV